jgi:hypothetical protein
MTHEHPPPIRMHKTNGKRSKCNLQLLLTLTTTSKMKKTLKTHKIKKLQQNMNPKTNKCR